MHSKEPTINKAKDIVGPVADKAADLTDAAVKKIKEARKED
ncbi:hypothetical protein RCH20_002494 [Psychrobacter sp. PL15]|nr:hypothetical protein [Psychrobacter sp. PL15]